MQRRFFCDSRISADSLRQAFMKIKPDRQTLDHLDNLGLGYVAKRRSRKAIATKYEKELPGVQSSVRTTQAIQKKDPSKYINTSPYPFNKGPRKVQTIFTAREWSEVGRGQRKERGEGGRHGLSECRNDVCNFATTLCRCSIQM